MSAFEVRRRSSSSRPARRRVATTYTPGEILDAMRRWAARYGEPPTMVDGEPARTRRLGAERRAEPFESGEWPSVRMVRGQFETFNAAVEAAGLRPRRAPSRLRPNFEDPRAILDAIVDWARRYRDVPTMADWDPTRARQLDQDWRIARYSQGTGRARTASRTTSARSARRSRRQACFLGRVRRNPIAGVNSVAWTSSASLRASA
jgi:hypothetical protein